MTSSKNYLDFVLSQLSDLDDVSWRSMMGEFIIYYRGKIIGGIYDNRFMVKPIKSVIDICPDAIMGVPYNGAKEMLVIENVDDASMLCNIVKTVYKEFYK